MLEVADEKGARDYESSIGAGAPEPEDYQGTELREDDRGLATAIVGDFLVIGSADGVRSVIDVSAGAEDAEPLSEDATAEEALDELPGDSFAQAYLSAEGIDSFLALSDGALAPSSRWSTRATPQGAAFSRRRGRERLPVGDAKRPRPRAKPRGGWLLRRVRAVPARAAGRARARHACLRRLRRRGRDR